MASLIEKYLKEVAEEQHALDYAKDELMGAQTMIEHMLPKVMNASINSGKSPQIRKAEREDIFRQILEDRYDVDGSNRRINERTARLAKLCDKFHGEMEVRFGDFAEEMEKDLGIPKGVMRIEILDGDEGLAEISSQNVPVKSLRIPHEQFKSNICNTWKKVTFLFSLDHIYPVMTIGVEPSKIKFMDEKSLYEHMNVTIGKLIMDPNNERLGEIPYTIEIDDVRQIVLPYKIGDFLNIPAYLQNAFIRSVARYKKTGKGQDNLIDNTERE